jgi:O-methyltransferase involved in polyketide biosynthesis
MLSGGGCTVAAPTPALDGVSATAWLTLAARARADVGRDGFVDGLAQQIVAAWPGETALQACDAGFVRGVLLRTQWFDDSACQFFAAHPQGMAVTLGSGLCTRRSRLHRLRPPPEAIDWLNIDLPEVIAWRDQLVPCCPAERNCAASLLDGAWLDALAPPPGQPVIVMLEGVCPYLPQAPLEALLRRLATWFEQRRMAGRLVLDVVHPALARWSTRVAGIDLPVCSGFEEAAEIVRLHPSMRLLACEHPFANFSDGHRQLDTTFRAIHRQPPYAMACICLGTA